MRVAPFVGGSKAKPKRNNTICDVAYNQQCRGPCRCFEGSRGVSNQPSRTAPPPSSANLVGVSPRNPKEGSLALQVTFCEELGVLGYKETVGKITKNVPREMKELQVYQSRVLIVAKNLFAFGNTCTCSLRSLVSLDSRRQKRGSLKTLLFLSDSRPAIFRKRGFSRGQTLETRCLPRANQTH